MKRVHRASKYSLVWIIAAHVASPSRILLPMLLSLRTFGDDEDFCRDVYYYLTSAIGFDYAMLDRIATTNDCAVFLAANTKLQALRFAALLATYCKVHENGNIIFHCCN